MANRRDRQDSPERENPFAPLPDEESETEDYEDYDAYEADGGEEDDLMTAERPKKSGGRKGGGLAGS